MHMAARGGHLEVIKFLVPYYGNRVHEKTEASSSPLHFAAQWGHSEVACYLIDEVKMDPLDRDKVCEWGAWLRREICKSFCLYSIGIIWSIHTYMYKLHMHPEM